MIFNDFLIEKVVIFTSNYKGGYDYEEIPEKKAEKLSNGVYKATIKDAYVYKKLGADKMLPINWSLFDMIPETETITQIDVTISITQEIARRSTSGFKEQIPLESSCGSIGMTRSTR